MSDFKKGDLVQGPRGYVLSFIKYGNEYKELIDVGDENLNYLTTWYSEDCRPYRDPAPVIEAARQVYSGFLCECALDDRMLSLSLALDCYSSLGVQPNTDVETIKGRSDEDVVEYKWLAMSEKRGATTSFKKPDWDPKKCVWDLLNSVITDPPAFLKPGQLWELVKPTFCELFEVDSHEYEFWNGYWWHKVEDHSTGTKPTADASLRKAALALCDYIDNSQARCMPPFNTMSADLRAEVEKPAIVDAGLYEAAKEVVYEWEQKGCPITSLGCSCADLRDSVNNSKPAETFQDFWDRVIDKADNDARISNVTMNYMYKHCMDAWDKPKECGEWCEHYDKVQAASVCYSCRSFYPTYGMPGCPHAEEEEK